ncbi:MAG: hypothetical protein V9F03_13400 [Microthrixaceae bacterium]
MTTQLRLIETDPTPEEGQRTPTGSSWDFIDEETRQRGLRGVAQAREALREANRRVAQREELRKAQKAAELNEILARSQARAAARKGTDNAPHHPDGHAAA